MAKIKDLGAQGLPPEKIQNVHKEFEDTAWCNKADALEEAADRKAARSCGVEERASGFWSMPVVLEEQDRETAVIWMLLL